jgi:hypothetical protein
MTESTQTKIFMLLAAPFILLANWAFAFWASQFAWWSWAEPVIFYGLGATGTVGVIVGVIMVLFAPKEQFGGTHREPEEGGGT